MSRVVTARKTASYTVSLSGTVLVLQMAEQVQVMPGRCMRALWSFL